MNIQRFEVRGYVPNEQWIPIEQIVNPAIVREWTVYENKAHPDQGAMSDWQSLIDTDSCTEATATCKRFNELAEALEDSHRLAQTYKAWAQPQLQDIADRTDSDVDDVVDRLVDAYINNGLKPHPMLCDE